MYSSGCSGDGFTFFTTGFWDTSILLALKFSFFFKGISIFLIKDANFSASSEIFFRLSEMIFKIVCSKLRFSTSISLFFHDINSLALDI